MILDKFQQKPHPVKPILKKYGVNNCVIARYLNLSPNYVSNILTGYLTPKKQIDNKLWQLVKELEKERGASAEP